MTTRFAAFFALAALIGCSSTPAQKAEPVAVSGVVQLPSGQPAKDVAITFLPNSSAQMQSSASLKADGKFSVQLTPGKYLYMIDSGAGLKAVPAKYHSASEQNTIEVPPGGTTDLTIKLQP
jgi:uncharacterized protein YcfL